MYDACAALHLHLPHDNQAISSLNSTLLSVFNETIKPTPNQIPESLLASIYCSTERTGDACFGICPNADLAGTGVRVAFYSQAVLNAVLVAYSPQDSPSAAWAATLLVSAVVIPAWVQKKQGRLSLYHATLVLNFATLSSLASLAVAPLCPIWRKRGMQIPLEQRRDSLRRPRHRASPSLGAESDMSDDESTAMLGQVNQERHPPGSKKNVTYQRVVLSLALMAQVALQWSYAALLYTSPYYAEVSCNKHTRVALFGWPLPANELAEHLFPVWALWLVFNGGVTLASGVFLVISGGRDTPAPKKNTESLKHTKLSALRNLIQNGPLRRRAFMVVALILAVGFLANSEIQHGANCFVSDGETQWGFGQVAALLLVFVPIWQLVVTAKNRWSRRRESGSRPATAAPAAEQEQEQKQEQEERDSFHMGYTQLDRTEDDTAPVMQMPMPNSTVAWQAPDGSICSVSRRHASNDTLISYSQQPGWKAV